MKQITAFQTSDGATFASESAAKIHEEKVQISRNIFRFLDGEDNKYKSGPQRAIAYTAILAWEMAKK